ncbi:MAG: hypothetical protein ACO3ZD_07450 [Cyanobium sp.]
MASVAPTPALSAGSGTAADRGVENLCAEALQRSAALRPPAYVCARTACRICALVSPAPAAWPPRSGGHRSGPCPDGAHLQLAISTGQGSDGVARANLKRLATQIANEYMRNHPRVLLHLRFLPEGDLVESVRARARLGAGPDLLISRVAPVEILEREGYLKPIEISPQQLDPLELKFLSRFRDGSSYDALPFLLQPMVACYDRRRLPRAPSRLDELPVRAAEGVRVGLPLQISELLWTASDFDADRALLNLFRTRVERMERGQLDWISCSSIAINRLKRKLGPHLGVSVLPSGTEGRPARPMARLQLVSFERDSTPARRQVATSFALFMLNGFSQTNLISKAFGNMPVNQNVVMPVKDSSALAAKEWACVGPAGCVWRTVSQGGDG